jgi:hypothetical protein
MKCLKLIEKEPVVVKSIELVLVCRKVLAKFGKSEGLDCLIVKEELSAS